MEKFKFNHLPKLLIKTGKEWFDGEPFQRSAIVAYYSILSLPALIIIILKIVGSFWEEEIVQGELLGEISKALGPETARSIKEIIESHGGETTSIFATIVGIATLIYGATAVFFQVQTALDDIWNAKSPYKNNIVSILMNRIKSFGFILIIGFLLLTSFVLTSILSTFSNRLERFLPEHLFEYIFVFDILISLGLIYMIFASMFKYLPSLHIPWKSVRIGAALTTILFMIGKYVLAFYFNTMEPGSTYGAAGSIILIMLWVSYSNLILLFGAYFTKTYAECYTNFKTKTI
ncbi:YihY/virulence factor BrkB family protein [Winogradskyella ursingii]|uniref:YihY/virulence factor BrkB family protein n=1 Tax=Winogradskyella ursingii TaxID=2686079 RepID=UPI00293BDD00|nr:YihY/virulence factor BrkB family protein [Winogradskyella ursingii]